MYSEEQLICELKMGNTDAYDQLVSNYTKQMYYLAYNILKISGTKEDIEECVSDVFLLVWQNIHDFDSTRGTFKTWILILTKFKALSYKRANEKSKNIANLEDYQIEDNNTVEKQIVSQETQEKLLEIINGFSKVDKELFIRRYFYNETIHELMERLGFSRSAIDNRLLRGRKKIKEELYCE